MRLFRNATGASRQVTVVLEDVVVVLGVERVREWSFVPDTTAVHHHGVVDEWSQWTGSVSHDDQGHALSLPLHHR